MSDLVIASYCIYFNKDPPINFDVCLNYFFLETLFYVYCMILLAVIYLRYLKNAYLILYLLTVS